MNSYVTGLHPLYLGTVHIWQIKVAAPEEMIRFGGSFLSDDEKQRAGRFYFDRGRACFSSRLARL
jgi:hypothetical protein